MKNQDYEHCEVCGTNIMLVGEPRPEGVVMNQQIPISKSTYTCVDCSEKPRPRKMQLELYQEILRTDDKKKLLETALYSVDKFPITFFDMRTGTYVLLTKTKIVLSRTFNDK